MISAIGWGDEASCSRSCGRRLLCAWRGERLEVAGEHVQTPPPSSGHVGATPYIKRYFG